MLVRFALANAFFVAMSAHAADWQSDIDAHGIRSASTTGTATIGRTESAATLRYKCAPGRRGNSIWSLEIAHADRAVAGFGFADFEGPDAPANGQRLSELALEGGLLQTRIKVAQTGYFAAEPPDTFVIESSSPAGQGGDLALLTDAIGPATGAITWSVQGARDPEQRLDARFAGAGAGRAIGVARIGCGPAPALTTETVEAWVGKDPNFAGVFDDAGLLWRLKALLGRDFDAFRLAIADAQPVARDGRIVYVVGHLRGDDKLAAAWMFDLDSGASEAALVESGKLRTIRDEGAPRITAPESVRSYLAAAM